MFANKNWTLETFRVNLGQMNRVNTKWQRRSYLSIRIIYLSDCWWSCCTRQISCCCLKDCWWGCCSFFCCQNLWIVVFCDFFTFLWNAFGSWTFSIVIAFNEIAYLHIITSSIASLFQVEAMYPKVALFLGKKLGSHTRIRDLKLGYIWLRTRLRPHR